MKRVATLARARKERLQRDAVIASVVTQIFKILVFLQRPNFLLRHGTAFCNHPRPIHTHIFREKKCGEQLILLRGSFLRNECFKTLYCGALIWLYSGSFSSHFFRRGPDGFVVINLAAFKQHFADHPCTPKYLSVFLSNLQQVRWLGLYCFKVAIFNFGEGETMK